MACMPATTTRSKPTWSRSSTAPPNKTLPSTVSAGAQSRPPAFSGLCAEDRVTPVNRLGELERAIMDVLWDSTEPLTVRQVGLRLTNRYLAHTTVMTVLDRLAKKGFARRQRDGRAWRYQAAADREAYVTELMLPALDQTGDRSAALASFARRVSDSEAEVLRRALESIGELPRDCPHVFPLVLVLAAVAGGTALGAAALASARWPYRSPGAAILLWQALGLSWGLA